MTERQTLILKMLNQPNAFLIVADNQGSVQILDQCIGQFVPPGGTENRIFVAREYRALIAAGCLIPALGYPNNMYRLWDQEIAARAHNSEGAFAPSGPPVAKQQIIDRSQTNVGQKQKGSTSKPKATGN
jgi:hypothetical protein